MSVSARPGSKMGENQGIVRLYQLYGKYIFSSLLEKQQSKAERKGRHSIYAESSSKSIDAFIKNETS